MEVLDRLIKFTTLRPRSEFEIKRWFVRKKVSDKDSEIALRELKKAGLIDDRAFVRWWVEQRITFRPKSRRMLVVELIKKGVRKELTEQVLDSLSELPHDEELARLVIEKRKKLLERLDPDSRKKKIITLLSGRGFNWGVIKKVIGD